MRFAAGVVRFRFDDFGTAADQERAKLGSPFSGVKANPDAVGREVGGDGDVELTGIRKDRDIDAGSEDIDRPAEGPGAGDGDLLTALAAGRIQRSQRGSGSLQRRSGQDECTNISPE